MYLVKKAHPVRVTATTSFESATVIPVAYMAIPPTIIWYRQFITSSLNSMLYVLIYQVP